VRGVVAAGAADETRAIIPRLTMVGKGTQGDTGRPYAGVEPAKYPLMTASAVSSSSALLEYRWGYLGQQKAVTVRDQQPAVSLIHA
jgi:hypothetical protein